MAVGQAIGIYWSFENADNMIVNELCLCYTMAVDTGEHKFRSWGQRMTME